jgi:hypothetical protein
MAAFVNWILKACDLLKLDASIGHTVSLSNDVLIHVVAYIPFLGGIKGMLLVDNYDVLRPYISELIELGYGFSVVDEPRLNEEFEIESFIEMFTDWGWYGDLTKKPAWIKPKS